MPADVRPNFLIVMTDQQRADAVSLAPEGWTPHLAGFAADAVRLSETHCPSPHCCPSRATFFTGLYPPRHGIWNNVLNERAISTDLRPGVTLWSETLAAAGYALHFSGKWHVTAASTPKDHGWREHFVSSVGGREQHGPNWDSYEQLAREDSSSLPRAPGMIQRPGYGDRKLYETLPADTRMEHDENVLAGALDAMDEVGGADQPWMIYAGFFGPHDPYAVPSEWLDHVPAEAAALPPSHGDDLRDKPGIYRRLREQVWDQLSPAEAIDARRHYLANCAYVDHLFGRLLARLKATGQEKNTVVVFLSDHGDYAGEHGLFCKGIAGFRGAYHIPGLVRWPAGGVRGGRVCDALVSLADFGPTFLELAGVPAAAQIFTGRSLKPLLEGVPAPGWRDFLATQCDGVELAYSQRGVFTRDWKYLYNGFDRDELYDLRSDPHEMTNLAARPECREVTQAMCRRLWQFAHAEGDTLFNDYFTVALAPFGPAEAFR